MANMNLEQGEPSAEGDVDDYPKLLTCEECGQVFIALPYHIRSKHDMTVDEYREKHDVTDVVVPGGLTSEELVAELTRLSDELDKPPSTTDMAEHGRYSTRPYYDHFGSWSDALSEAGMKDP